MNAHDLLKDALDETGVSLSRARDEVLLYTAQRAAHLSTLVGQPGFELALRAERDSVALYAGVSASIQATAAEGRILGIIQGILFALAGGR